MIFTSSFWKHCELKQRINVSQGGTSSGKTYSILQMLYLLASNKNGIHISIVSESIPHLKRGAMRDFFNILDANNLYVRDNHNKSDSIYKVGDSIIEFFSADNHAKLRGARRDVLYINECNNISYEAFNQLEVRTRKRVYLDYNPVSSFWVHEHILHRDDVQYLQTTYKDNDALDENIVKSIEQRKGDLNWWRVYGLGEVGSLEGVIYSNWQTGEQKEYKSNIYGLDFGFTNDPTALIELQYGENILCKELLYTKGLTVTDIIKELEKLGIDKRAEIIADNARPEMIEEIYRAGYNIKPCVKGRDSVEHGIAKVQEKQLIITKESVNLIKELRNYQWMQDKDGNYLNKPIDNWNHGLDALRYAVQHRDKKGMNKSWLDDL